MSDLTYAPFVNEATTVFSYEYHDRSGVICIAVTGLVSLVSILYVLAFQTPKPSTYHRTHLFGYLISLLLANSLQSVGTVMSLKWVMQSEVTDGTFCSLQGGIKQIGNVSTAFWSLMMAIHLFNLLFMRSVLTKFAFWAAMIFGWSLVMVVVLIGPTVIQTTEKGPYFGMSGAWCWITYKYPKEQIFLEYFIEFFSAGLSIILYTIILLRLRGNLIRAPTGEWRLQFALSWDSWRLVLGRDLLDTAMLRFARNMIWFPVAYTVILLPVTIARLNYFAGGRVSFAVTVFTDIVFNMTGVVNVALLLVTRRFYPDMQLPEFHTQRNKAHTDRLLRSGGVTPFTLTRSDTAESYERERETTRSVSRAGSSSSNSSHLSSWTNVEETGRPMMVEQLSPAMLTHPDSALSVVSSSSRAELIPKDGR